MEQERLQEPLQLLILCGLQGAGKSTFYRTFFAPTHELISRDLFPNNRQPRRRQLQLIAEAFQAGRSVVVDNTNVTRAERAELVLLAEEHAAEVICYYFVPDLKQSLERNRQRTGKARVPDVAIYATYKRLEPPEVAEGFAQLYSVHALEDGQFSLKKE